MYVLASPEETTVAVDPSVIDASPGQYFTINITVANVTDLYAWEFWLEWSQGLLDTETGNVTEGPFLKQGGTTAFLKKKYTNHIGVVCLLLGSIPGVSGGGTLASIVFKVLGAQNATLNLYHVTLQNSSLQVIGDWKYKDSPNDGYFYTGLPAAQFTYTPHPTQFSWRPTVNETVTFNATGSYDPDEPYDSTPGGIVSYKWDFDDGNITTVSNPIITHVYTKPRLYQVTLNVTDDEGETDLEQLTLHIQLHDIRVVDVAASPTEVNVGSIVTVNVTVMNKGSVPEHFNLTAYYNHKPMATEADKNLQTGENMTITFSWNTTDVPTGNYQIWAETTNVEGEENLQNNKFVDGTVTVKPAQQLSPAIAVVAAVVVVAVSGLSFALVYAKKKRKTSNHDCAALFRISLPVF